MRYDPFRNMSPQNDPYANPYRITDPDREVGSDAAILLGATLLLAIGGFAYFYTAGDRTAVATNDLRPAITQPQTTGAGRSQ